MSSSFKARERKASRRARSESFRSERLREGTPERSEGLVGVERREVGGAWVGNFVMGVGRKEFVVEISVMMRILRREEEAGWTLIG